MNALFMFERCANKSNPININIVNDNVLELNEMFMIKISDPSTDLVFLDSEYMEGIIMIIDDESGNCIYIHSFVTGKFVTHSHFPRRYSSLGKDGIPNIRRTYT